MCRFIAVAFALCAATILSNDQQNSTNTLPQAAPQLAREIPGLPGFRVEEASNNSGDIRALAVYHEGHQTQTLNVCTDKPVPRRGKLGSIAFTDFNFDGYPDLAMLASSANENNIYCVWLFDPETKRFALSEDLSHLTNPAPDPDKKSVVALKHETCTGDCYERETYVWSGNRLLPKEYVAVNEDPALSPTEDCRFVRSVKQEKNGRMAELARQRVDGGGVPCEPHPF
jgi:hypothetical protein